MNSTPLPHPNRQAHLRYLLLDLPTHLTHSQATISGLARALGISRATASSLINSDPVEFPISLKMAVRLYLATREYLNPASEVCYPASPEDWLNLDQQYQVPSFGQRVEYLVGQLEAKVSILAISADKT